MRFLHAADFHLGLRVTRFGDEVNSKVREARMKSLEQMLVRAEKLRLDFILLAGDLFDDNQVDAVTSRRAFEMLASARLPVYVLPGNHDPLTVNSVYNRPPWSSAAGPVHVLRDRKPVEVPGGVLLPCPLVARNSLNDPTRWIPPPDEGDDNIRIGVAHGSFNDRPNLCDDDHLIDRHVVDEKRLDYLALGHWHRPSRHADRAGVIRAAYPGVPEPMGFAENPEFSIGWSAYGAAPASDSLFHDDGRGRALFVTLEQVEAIPVIEEIDTGRLQWRDETHTLRDEDELSALIDAIGRREGQEQQLLRLHLSGTLPAAAHQRLDELDTGAQGGIKSRYLWFELDALGLRTEPSDAELQALAGNGIVRAVYDALRAEMSAADPALRERTDRTLLLLYRYAQEVR